MRGLIALLFTANVMVALWLSMERQNGEARALLPEPDIGNLQLLVEEQAEPSSPVGGQAASPVEGRRPGDISDLPPASPLSDATVVRLRKAAPADTVARETTPAQSGGANSVCWELGPFEQLEQTEAKKLPVGIRRVAVHRARARVTAGYYVLVPPVADRDQALQTIRQLKSKGVRDSWLFPSGPLRNAISLGMFSKQENALRRRRQIEALGFPVQLQQRERTVDGYAIVVEGRDVPGNERLIELLAPRRWRRVTCPDERP